MPDDTPSITVIRSAASVVAWDERAKSHVYLSDADVAFQGGVLTFAGRGFPGPVSETIDGRDLMVMPGLVNIHSHPSSEPMNKGLIDEIGSPGFYNSSLYEYLPIFRADAEAVPSCVRVALSELLLSGGDNARRSVNGASRLARSAGRGGDAGLRGADVPLGPLVHE